MEIGTEKGLKLLEHWFVIGGLVAMARGDRKAAAGLLKSAAHHTDRIAVLLAEIQTAGRITQAGGRTTQDRGGVDPEALLR